VNCSSTWQLQHPHNIILVGHKFGGILIKSLIIEVNKVAHRKIRQDVTEKEAKDSCEAFQHNLSGIMFYDVPHFMTTTDIQIMFQENIHEGRRSDPPRYHKTPSVSQALSNEIEAIIEDFEDSIAHDHTKICVISHGLKVHSLTFMLYHVLDDGHLNILAFVEGRSYGKS